MRVGHSAIIRQVQRKTPSLVHRASSLVLLLWKTVTNVPDVYRYGMVYVCTAITPITFLELLSFVSISSAADAHQNQTQRVTAAAVEPHRRTISIIHLGCFVCVCVFSILWLPNNSPSLVIYSSQCTRWQ